MSSALLHQKILKENVWSSLCDLQLKLKWITLQDNDDVHKKSTSHILYQTEKQADTSFFLKQFVKHEKYNNTVEEVTAI